MITKNTPISDCGFTTRARNCMRDEDIRTVGDLTTKTETELRRVPGLGNLSRNELIDFLALNGFELKA